MLPDKKAQGLAFVINRFSPRSEGGLCVETVLEIEAKSIISCIGRLQACRELGRTDGGLSVLHQKLVVKSIAQRLRDAK